MNFKTIATLVSLFLTLPIWFYLLWYVLKAVNADELTMFLFWVYVPFNIFVAIVFRLAKD